MKIFAVIGATGQVGAPLTSTLLDLGHGVRMIHRAKTDRNAAKLNALEAKGAVTTLIPDLHNMDALVTAFTGCDTVVICTYSDATVLEVSEPIWLEAAVRAGVKRFVPNEFGAHTVGVENGACIIFDRKKAVHKKIWEAGIGWTFYYNGGIFDYFIPNLRYFRKITTFGNIDLPIYTHDIQDIGSVAAMAISDDRTLNKCVQLDYNKTTQRDMVELIKKTWPDYPFEFEHFDSEYITKKLAEATDDVTAKKGAETDKERFGINYVVYVQGKLASFDTDPPTVAASSLFPYYKCTRTIEQAIADSGFMFEEDKAPDVTNGST